MIGVVALPSLVTGIRARFHERRDHVHARLPLQFELFPVGLRSWGSSWRLILMSTVLLAICLHIAIDSAVQHDATFQPSAVQHLASKASPCPA